MISNFRLITLFLLVLLLGIYSFVNFFPDTVFGSFTTNYVIQPLLWVLLFLFVLLLLPRNNIKGKFRIETPILVMALLLGLFHLSLQLVGGLFAGFGDSPYNFDARSIFFNFILVVSILLGKEISRAWLVRRFAAKHQTAGILFVGLLFAFLTIPLSKITGLGFTTESIRTVNADLIPALAQNLLATVLAYYGGARASFTYMGILQAFWWFSPILPDLPWAIKGLINTAIPITGFILVQNYVNNLSSRRTKSSYSDSNSFPLGWVAVTITAVVIIWFSVGIFPVRPSLIISGSMSPEYNVGDVVIIADTKASRIIEGDVIRFQEGKIAVMHRVVSIEESPNGPIFITKGDANDAVDSAPVVAEQVKGKAAFTIPKIGWIAIYVRSWFGL